MRCTRAGARVPWLTKPVAFRGRRFAPGATPNSCVVDFSVQLRVSSPLHAHALELFFAEVAERQICAFEERCRRVYRDNVR